MFARNQGNAIRRPGTDRVALYENCVQITEKKEILDLQQVLRSIHAESVRRPLNTMYERCGNVLQFTLDWGEKTAQCLSSLFCKVTLFPVSGQLSLTCTEVMAESNLAKKSDSISSSIKPLPASGQLSLTSPNDTLGSNLVTDSSRKSSATNPLQQVTCNPQDGGKK